MIPFIKSWVLPGSAQSLLLFVSIATGMLFAGPRGATWGRRLLVAVVALQVFMSLPVGAWALAGLLGAGYAPATVQQVAGANALVVLDGGSYQARYGDVRLSVAAPTAAFRAAEAARVFRLMPPDSKALVTAGSADPAARAHEGDALRDLMVAGGIPAERITIDRESLDTYDHVARVRQWMAAEQRSRFVLVTAATHIRRATRVFRAAGLDPIPSSAPVRLDDPPISGWRWLRPDSLSLEISREAIYDIVGLSYYALRGVL